MKLLRSVYNQYLRLCDWNERLAVPLATNLPVIGRVRCHPRFIRSGWSRDPENVMQTLHSLISEGDVFFDVGANVGCTALIGSKKVGKDGTVVAFEPAAKNVGMLQYNLRVNRILNCRIEESCVGETSGHVEFTELLDGLSTSNSMTFTHRAETPNIANLEKRTVRLPCVSLDDYVANTSHIPNVVKIDVEGAELAVLAGGINTLRTHRPSLLIGIHPFWWPDGQPVDAITNFLGDLGYEVKNTMGVHERPEKFADYVCVHKSVATRTAIQPASIG